MANAFKIGDKIKQVVSQPECTILEKQFIGDDICYHVEFIGADGEVHDRWFKESEMEAV